MNWDEVGAIGQVLGSIAVFVTLGYLALQVRQARGEMRRSLSQGRVEAVIGLLMARATDERLNAINVKAEAAFNPPHPFVAALTQRAGLTAEDATALLVEQAAYWNYRLQVIPYAVELPAADRSAFDWATRTAYGSTGAGRLFYETFVKTTQHADAVRYIDNLLAQPG